ncbi:hypothetical protein RFI_18290 [Reticulomyxa filosa]|uniref:Uncharacterized protein n=1 Tax=Reticulomyxa filosa TaxID=46433 RepID=X6MZQ6_RETFI|nr:hypothetical protein RFI_18290 [Reticulomyxa filosa]|eukprot:ETO18954.1 hypothetical protein RFI_18290 [Reticulomyxa filosa]
MLAHEELIVFQRQLRKYREMKKKKNINESDSKTEIPNAGSSNKFEASMSSFNRKARDSCRTLLSVWNDCAAIATRIAQEYDYEFAQNDSFEQLIHIFDDFVTDLKKARVHWETSQNQKKIQMTLEKHIKKRPSLHELKTKNIVFETIDEESKKKSEVKMDTPRSWKEQAHNGPIDIRNEANKFSLTSTSVIKKPSADVATKPNDSSNQISESIDPLQKGKRRKRSLSSADIPIGSQIPAALQEDKEVE